MRENIIFSPQVVIMQTDRIIEDEDSLLGDRFTYPHVHECIDGLSVDMRPCLMKRIDKVNCIDYQRSLGRCQVRVHTIALSRDMASLQ